MEQTQNTFASGLQMDTHPMQQGNDSLTDALNATFVTMNGNEIVLQNDMGNASVQHAYLPHGYVPVGMKEYGGVIYVASYNPLTDRGQIGSFPSPQRRHFEHEEGVGNFNPENFLEDERLKQRTMLIPINNGNDTILRAGDKFVLYSNNLYDFKDYISNWENVEGAKIKSPKNNYFTLSAGILNSKNEFVDITKTLHRFDDYGEIITEFENESELYKFNKGYFINNLFEESDYNYISSQADSAVEEARELDKLKLNTYAYKLVGPLYIKAELNAPTDFDFSVSGTNHDGEIELNINYVLTYNCPDGIHNLSGENNDIYYDYYDNEVTTFGLKLKTYDDIFDDQNVSDIPGITKYDSITNTYKVINNKTVNFNIESVFESRTLDINFFQNGTYYTQEPIIFKKDLIYKIEVTSDINNLDLYIKSSDDIFYKTTNKSIKIQRFEDYILVENLYGVPIPLYIGSNMISSATVSANTQIFTDILIPTFKKWGNEDIDIEISDLAREFSIDLSKLGSGEMELKSWRFYNDVANKATSITYGFDAYPKEGHEFKNLRFDFWEVSGEIQHTDDDITSGGKYVGSYSISSELGYNGIRDDVIKWDDLYNKLDSELSEIGLKERQLYQIVIYWEDYNNDGLVESNYELRWLLTTPLFNNCCFQGKQEFIIDFCNPSPSEKDVYDQLLTIVPEISVDNPNYSAQLIKSQIKYSKPDEESAIDVNKKFGYKTDFSVNLQSDISVVWDESNYPQFIQQLTPPLITATLQEIDKSENNIPIVGSGNFDESSDWITYEDSDESYEESSESILYLNYQGKISAKDLLYGPVNQQYSRHTGTEFKNLKEILEESQYQTSNTTTNKDYIYQSAINLMQLDSGSHRTKHFVILSSNDHTDQRDVSENKGYGLFCGGHLKYVNGLSREFPKYNKDDEKYGCSYHNASQDTYLCCKMDKDDDYDWSFNFDMDDFNYCLTNDDNDERFIIQGVSIFNKNGNSTKNNCYDVAWIRTGKETWALLGIKNITDREEYSTDSKTMHFYGDTNGVLHYYDWFKDPERIIMAYQEGDTSETRYTINVRNSTYNRYYEADIYYKFKLFYE